MEKPEGNFNKKTAPDIDTMPNPRSLTGFWKGVA